VKEKEYKWENNKKLAVQSNGEARKTGKNGRPLLPPSLPLSLSFSRASFRINLLLLLLLLLLLSLLLLFLLLSLFANASIFYFFCSPARPKQILNPFKLASVLSFLHSRKISPIVVLKLSKIHG